MVSWTGLHDLYTGTADGEDPPLDFLPHGGRQVGHADAGLGTVVTMS